MNEEEFYSLFHEDDQQAISEHMDKVVKSKQGEIMEVIYRFRKSNGEWMWCHSRDAVFNRDDGKPTQFMGTFWDITRIKEGGEY